MFGEQDNLNPRAPKRTIFDGQGRIQEKAFKMPWTIKEISSFKTKRGQARPHALEDSATPKSRAADKYAKGEEKYLRTKPAVAKPLRTRDNIL